MSKIKKNADTLEILGIKLWDKFDEIMSSKGFRIFITNDNLSGRGTMAFDANDAFVPIFHLCYRYNSKSYDPSFISIHLEDRNGNNILTGNTVSIYSLNVKKEDNIEDIELRFDKMMDDVFLRYGSYNKENRLDSAFKGLKTERFTF